MNLRIKVQFMHNNLMQLIKMFEWMGYAANVGLLCVSVGKTGF